MSRWSTGSSAGRFDAALSFEAALVAYVLFTVFLLGLVRLKNRLVEAKGHLSN